MITPKETNALIRELKKNREDMLPKCKLKIASQYENLGKICGLATIHQLTGNGTWEAGYCGVERGSIYSLPKSFREVPEVTEGWVVVPVDDNGFVSIDDFDLWWGEVATMILHKYKVSHFGGYIWDSRLHGEYLSLDLYGYFGAVKTNDPAKWDKPATPIALRFWSTDVAYACTLGFKPWNADEWPKV